MSDLFDRFRLGLGLMCFVFIVAGCSGRGGSKNHVASPAQPPADHSCPATFIKGTAKQVASSAVRVRLQCGLEEDQFLQACELVDESSPALSKTE